MDKSPRDSTDRAVRLREALNDCVRRRGSGEVLPDQAILAAHPDLLPELAEQLRALALVEGAMGRVADDPDLTISAPAEVYCTQIADLAGLPSDSFAGYQILRKIHRGGQGVVFEAVQLSTKRKVAVKVMLEGPFASRSSRDRFQREVELVAALRHPNIVAIHESGEAHGNAYFAMDLVEGGRLDDFVRAQDLRPREIVTVMHKVCDAVCAAHRQGVMHRDLKPSNILVDEAGEPHVLDFGLAKGVAEATGAGRDAPDITRADHIMGTLKYMSPEQTRGGLELVDIRTDVYSLGVILYELLTGAVPYRTDVELTETIKQIREAMPARPSRHNRRLDSELDAILLMALEKNPDRRYQSAGELGEDLAAWLDSRPVSARSSSSLYLMRKIAVRHWSATAIVAAFLVSILSFSAISFEAYLRASEALDRRSAAELSAIRSAQRAAGFQELHFQAMRMMSLVGFIQAWRDDNLQDAGRHRALLRDGSPEQEAAQFLLDPNYPSERLRQKLEPAETALAFFVIGEREWKAGHSSAAVEAFQASASASGTDIVIKALTGTRLKEIRSNGAGSAP